MSCKQTFWVSVRFPSEHVLSYVSGSSDWAVFWEGNSLMVTVRRLEVTSVTTTSLQLGAISGCQLGFPSAIWGSAGVSLPGLWSSGSWRFLPSWESESVLLLCWHTRGICFGVNGVNKDTEKTFWFFLKKRAKNRTII